MDDVRSGHHHRNPTASRRGRIKPLTAQPFPRSQTTKITSPGVTDFDDIAEANRQWFAWLRVLSNVTQMQLPPNRRAKS